MGGFLGESPSTYSGPRVSGQGSSRQHKFFGSQAGFKEAVIGGHHHNITHVKHPVSREILGALSGRLAAAAAHSGSNNSPLKFGSSFLTAPFGVSSASRLERAIADDTSAERLVNGPKTQIFYCL